MDELSRRSIQNTLSQMVGQRVLIKVINDAGERILAGNLVQTRSGFSISYRDPDSGLVRGFSFTAKEVTEIVDFVRTGSSNRLLIDKR